MKTVLLILFIVALVAIVIDGFTGQRLDWRAGIPITVILAVGFLLVSDVLRV